MLPQSEAGIDEALRQQLRHKLEGVHEEEVLQIRESHGSSSVSAQIALFSRSESWLFGDVWSPVPTDEHRAPLSLLFVAQRDAGQWQYATETDDAFVPLINCLPNSLLAPAAKRFFSEDRAFSVDTDLGLPWLRASRGKLTGGPHGNSGGRPYSALDFKPPQGIIRAPAGGVVTFGCSRVRIRIDHGNGYSTHYYHIDKATAVASGTIITEGDYLGKMSARIDCGGRATGPHVHLALKRKGRFIAVEGRTLGGWTFYEGDHAYGGRAVEGSTGKTVRPGGFLVNHGSVSSDDDEGLPRATVLVGHGNFLSLRTGPSTRHRKLGRLGHGEVVRIKCTARGELVKGGLGTTDLWNQLSSGEWASDAWLNTGSDGPVAPFCGSAF